MLMFFLQSASKLGLILSLVVVCVCFLICFPIMVEQISIRVGGNFILLATSNVYLLAQALSAIFAQLFGFVLKNGSKSESQTAIYLGMGIMTLSFLLSVYAGVRNKNPFAGQAV